MAYYVGIDVGLRRSSLCIVDELGAVCLERIVASEIEEIVDAVRDFTECVEGLALETTMIDGGVASSVRATTVSTMSGPSCDSDAAPPAAVRICAN
jgi:hypothetical protein